MGLITALAFFVCILLHELGHALVAQRLGIPLRGITLFLFGGVAELEGEPESAGAEFLMAIAGPAVTVFLALVCGALYYAGGLSAWPWQVVLVLGYLAIVNLSVLIFNLVPAFPLDGGRVLRSILWGASGNLRRATYWASLAGRAFAWVLFGLAVLEFINGDLMGGVWMFLIGLFLSEAASSGYQQVLVRQGAPRRAGAADHGPRTCDGPAVARFAALGRGLRLSGSPKDISRRRGRPARRRHRHVGPVALSSRRMGLSHRRRGHAPGRRRRSACRPTPTPSRRWSACSASAPTACS